jgi:hypothetical protein
LTFGLVAVPAMLMAQSISTSALGGLVRDPDGKPVAGAVIRIQSPSLIGGEKSTRSASNGSYRFAALPPGRYKIVVENAGMPTLTGTELLELNRTSTVNWKFAKVGAAMVEVVATAANLDSAPTGVTTNYNTEELATLPAERSLSAIMNLTPGVNSNFAWGGDSRENVWMMDGINISDPQSNTQWIFPNPDWFSEIQVGGIGAPAEFGGFTGAYVNGLLKRGGNEFSGTVSGYYGDAKWEAISTNPDQRFSADDRKLAPAKNWDLSFTVGGAILKDKLWFFTSFERKSTETTPIGAPLATKRNELLTLTKLTWQVTQSATLEGIYEYDYTTQDRRYISSYTSPDATNHEISPNHSYGLTWTQVLGSDKVLTIKGFGYSGRYDQPGYNGEDYGLDTYDYFNGVEYFHNAMPIDQNFRGRGTLSATFDWYKTGLVTAGDSHAFRMGLEKEWVTDEELQRNPGNIGLMGQVSQDSKGNDIVLTDYFWTGGGWNIKEHASRLTGFIQDTWIINPRLTLRPGLRWENQKANAYGGPTVWNTSTLAPRFGITYAVTQDQANVLKLHWGRFYSAFSASYIDRMYPSMLPAENHYYWGTAASGYNPVQIDPYNYASWPKPVLNDPNNPAYETLSTYAPTDPNARQPYMDETMLSFEHKFKGPWSVSGTLLYRIDKDSLLRKDLAKDTGSYVNKTFTNYAADPAGNAKITVPVWYSSIGSDQHDWRVMTVPEAKRAFTSTTVSLNRQLQDGWSLNASYTHARRYGNSYKTNGYDPVFENPNNQVNSNGLLPNYNDDEFKCSFLYELPLRLRFSAVYTYLSGTRFTPYVRSASINGTRYLINIEPLGSEKYPSEHLLDMRLSERIPVSKTAGVEVFAEVFNALNTGTALKWSTRADSSSYKLPSSVERGRRLVLGFRVQF